MRNFGWDAAEKFNQSLAEDRARRGVPDSSLGRELWKMEQAWGELSPMQMAGLAIAFAGAGMLGYRLIWNQRSQDRSKKLNEEVKQPKRSSLSQRRSKRNAA